MESLISTFHLDLKLFLAQLINFAIVFAVLYFFALKPLVKTMAERTKKIETGLSDAKQAAEKLAQAQTEQKEILKQGRIEAGELLAAAAKQADDKKSVLLERAKEEIALAVTNERKQMRQEKDQIMAEIKAESADLILAVTEKILMEKLDSKKDHELLKKLL